MKNIEEKEEEDFYPSFFNLFQRDPDWIEKERDKGGNVETKEHYNTLELEKRFQSSLRSKIYSGSIVKFTAGDYGIVLGTYWGRLGINNFRTAPDIREEDDREKNSLLRIIIL